jgi:hypothetical protein
MSSARAIQSRSSSALGQQVRLLVVQELDAVLQPTQEDVGLVQPRGGGRLHQRARHQALQAAPRGARAHLRELPAARHQHAAAR